MYYDTYDKLWNAEFDLFEAVNDLRYEGLNEAADAIDMARNVIKQVLQVEDRDGQDEESADYEFKLADDAEE